jgi:Putative metallopeptidase domain
MNDLTTRILHAIPAGAYEMHALLTLLRIEETDTVPTASVSCERRPVLRINPEFVRRHCRTDEHLFLLVMHELHHVLLGHTRLFPRATRAHNLAFDALINAMLVLRFPAQAYRSFFLDLYGDEEGPMRLLAPPADHEVADTTLRRLHHLLYEDQRTTSEEVFNAMHDALTAAGDGSTGAAVVLLGSHAGEGGDDEWGTDGRVDEGFIAAIRDIVEKWPPPETPIRGRSLADALSQTVVKPDPPAARVLASLRRALLGAATKRTAGAVTELRAIAVQDVVPTASDRRAAVVRSAGAQPLLYWRPAEVRRGRVGRARVYLDVSGSMDAYVPFLYGALVALRGHVERDVFLFSTVVSPVSLQDLQRGRVDTTGGTDIRCVIDHAFQHCVRKMLIVTDGYVGRPTAAHVKGIHQSGLEVRVALTPEGWRKDLDAVSVRMDELPVLAPAHACSRRAS